ncbi:hypothetical protein BDA96_03G219300 [Sorghum bicolor]|uniref:Uncharacterized protein n=2 Tax=Sorghum bicolor TaxID=4558 RepID=A0A921REB0_SORBI|nr:hypothetical protein BDA96_03G219300 [Sorghum bicolor]OQU87080.1 hypothetical protein SORBI_3003G201850 [Sorghum bicolor]
MKNAAVRKCGTSIFVGALLQLRQRPRGDLMADGDYSQHLAAKQSSNFDAHNAISMPAAQWKP